MLSRLKTLQWTLTVLAVAILAFPSVSTAKDAINTNWQGVAVKGYDPVAYFTMGEPVKGNKEFQINWQGAKWRFSSAVHRDLFAANPEKYAPQYGGY